MCSPDLLSLHLSSPALVCSLTSHLCKNIPLDFSAQCLNLHTLHFLYSSCNSRCNPLLLHLSLWFLGSTLPSLYSLNCYMLYFATLHGIHSDPRLLLLSLVCLSLSLYSSYMCLSVQSMNHLSRSTLFYLSSTLPLQYQRLSHNLRKNIRSLCLLSNFHSLSRLLRLS